LKTKCHGGAVICRFLGVQLRRRWRWLRAKGTVVLTVKLTVKINDAQQIKMTKNLRNVEHKLLKTSANSFIQQDL
jgi:hypothetical protein